MADAPIGIFDSGYGGLTVARAVLDQLPHEPVALLRRHRAQPYGPRPIAEVRALRARVPRPPRRPGRQAARHRLQQRQRRGAARRPRALRRARRRGDPAGRAPRRRAPPATARSASSRPEATATSRRLRRRLRRGARTIARDHPGLPAVRGVRRGRGHRRPRAARRGPRVPRPGRAAGVDTLDPRLHALPAAHRRHLLRHGRRRDAGVQRRGDRQGRLPRCSPTHDLLRPDGLPAARAPLPHHRRPRRVRAARAPVPRPRGRCGQRAEHAWRGR